MSKQRDEDESKDAKAGKPATKDSHQNPEPAQPSSNDQSGSAGRRTSGDTGQGQDTGQGRYGQTGLGGPDTETDGQADYRKSGEDGARARRERDKV